jgi:hypothetical protein
MLNFKPKIEKKCKFNKNSLMTLDIKHKEFISEFNTNDTIVIPKLKNEIKQLKMRLNCGESIEQTLEIKDKINNIKQEIKELKNKKKQYFLNNSKLIFDYFENKKNIAECKPIEKSTKNSLINSFFKINETPDIKNDLIEIQSENIVKKYLANIDDVFLDVNCFVYQSDICKVCYKGELIPHDDEGILVCNNCFRSIPYLIENEKPSYKEPPKEVCFYAYKRINHFKEILAQFQGKETTQIPNEVIENIKLQVKKERIKLSQITNNKTKEILKKLGYNKYYEHIPFIKDKLGIKPPIMSPELEEILCNLFIELQSPYSKYVPKYRVNFLNYYYTAYKLCEILDETSYLEHFPMLKDKDKRIEQDSIWEKICTDLNWEFIPTV